MSLPTLTAQSGDGWGPPRGQAVTSRGPAGEGRAHLEAALQLRCVRAGPGGAVLGGGQQQRLHAGRRVRRHRAAGLTAVPLRPHLYSAPVPPLGTRGPVRGERGSPALLRGACWEQRA